MKFRFPLLFLACLFSLSSMACGYGGFARNCSLQGELTPHGVHHSPEIIFIGEVIGTTEKGAWFNMARVFNAESHQVGDSIYVEREFWSLRDAKNRKKFKVGDEWMMFVTTGYMSDEKLYECERSARHGSTDFKNDLAFFLDLETRPNGENQFKDSKGNLTAVGEMMDGKPQGEWIYFNADGRKIALVNFQDGEKHGEAFYYSGNGEVNTHIVSEEGKAVLTQNYSTNGMIYREVLIAGDVVSTRSYNSNGSLRNEYVVNETAGTSTYRYFHPDGRPKSVQHYKDNQAVGVWKEWNQNGKLISSEVKS